MTWSQPLASARSALALEPTVPMTLAPSALAHWQASSPMPPAAAWIRTRCPGSTLKVLCSRYQTVSPFSIRTAPCSGDVVGQFHQLVGRDIPLGGVAAETEIIGDAVAG